jgi:hypothetical protein
MANDANSWWKILLTIVLTAALSVAGDYFLQRQKTKVEVQRERARLQEDALSKLGHELNNLEGNVVFMYNATEGRGNGEAVRRQAISTATVMADMFQDSQALDGALPSKKEIHSLLESLAPVIADVRESPEKNTVELRLFYSNEFSPKLEKAKKAIEDDKRKVRAPLS